jgi:hypothetical protein
VSVRDYADFALSYAGIGKSDARQIGGVVHVTVAGVTRDPLDTEGPLLRNLARSFELYGDPRQPATLHDRAVALLVLAARVRVEPNRPWDTVEPAVRKALLDRFAFGRRDLGRDVLLSDAIETIQSVAGVVYVDVERFDAVTEEKARNEPAADPSAGSTDQAPRAGGAGQVLSGLRSLLMNTSAPKPRIPVGLTRAKGGAVLPAEVCFLDPDIPNTLILEAIP